MYDKFLNFIHKLDGDRVINETVINGYMAVYPDVGRKLYEDCSRSLGLLNDSLFESSNNSNARQIMQNDEFDTIGDLTHDYPIFMGSMTKSNHPESLSVYPIEEYAKKGTILYKFKNLNAGYGIDKDGDVISVHNNTGIGGLGDEIMKSAKRHGGKKLDHFDIPTLTNLYTKHGFQENERFTWEDQYAPKDWDYEKLGRPDVVMRSL